MFDPTKPADHSPGSSQEIRDQLNALKELIDAQAATIADLQTQIGQCINADQLNNIMSDYVQNNSSANANNVNVFDHVFNDPPSGDEVGEFAAKVNELISGLHR